MGLRHWSAMSLHIKNQRLEELREANIAKTLLLDQRRSRKLAPIELPSKLHAKLEKLQASKRDGRRVSIESDDANEVDATGLARILIDHKIKTSGKPPSINRDDEILDEQEMADLTWEFNQKLQGRIEKIANEIYDKYTAKKSLLDEQGIFHPAANLQRARAMCLVDLQRHINVNKLRRELAEEMQNTPFRSKNEEEKKDGDLSGKLDDMLEKKRKEKSRLQKVSAVRNNMRNRLKSNMMVSSMMRGSLMSTSTMSKESFFFSPARVLSDVEAKNSPLTVEIVLRNHPQVRRCVETLRKAKEVGTVHQLMDVGSSLLELCETQKDSTSLSSCNTTNLLLQRVHAKLEDGESTIEALDFDSEPIESCLSFEMDKDVEPIKEEVDGLHHRKEKINLQYKKYQDEISKILAASSPIRLNMKNEKQTTAIRQNDITNELNSSEPSSKEMDVVHHENCHQPKDSSTASSKSVQHYPICLPKTRIIEKGRGKHSAHRVEERKEAMEAILNIRRWEWTPESKRLSSAPSHTIRFDGNNEDMDSSFVFPELDNYHAPDDIGREHKVVQKHEHDGGNELALQRRLESIWSTLHTPITQRLYMLEKYTQIQDPYALEKSIDLWEKCSAFIGIREKLIHIRREIQEYGTYSIHNRITAECLTMMERYNCPLEDFPSQSMTEEANQLTLSWVERTLPKVSKRGQIYLDELFDVVGDEATYCGSKYVIKNLD